MKFQTVLILVIMIFAGCGGATPVAPTASETQTQGTAFPTLPLPTATEMLTESAPATAAATAELNNAAPTQTVSPVTSTEAPASTSAARLTVPRIVNHFELNPLPGEGRAPVALALLGKDLYVANRTTSNIGIVGDGRVRAFLPLEASPTALVADTVRNRVYASSYTTPTLYLIENDKVTKQVSVTGRVNALALDGDLVYVALDNDAVIERYDANTLTKKDELKLAQGYGVSDLVIDKQRNRLYAGEYGRIVAVDLATFQELNTFESPYLYAHFAVNPADGSIWSGAYDDKASKAYIVGYTADGQELARLVIGSDLNAVAFDGEGRLYVLDRFNNQVHVIQTPQAQLVTTVQVNETPDDAEIDFEQGVLYVANQDNDNLSVIDLGTLKVTNTIAFANNINALAANKTNKRVYAVNGSTNALYVIEGDKVIAEAKTGLNPVDVAVDEILHRLYVANRADGTLTVLDENSLDLLASPFITRALATVAVDAENRKVFAGSAVVDPDTFTMQSAFYAQGVTLNSQTTPQLELVNPSLKRLYALASNGIPGSNSRTTLFRFDYADLEQSKMLGSKNGGNTSAFDIDAATNNLFAANTHPLAYTNGLDVFDAQDNLVQSLPLRSRTTALVVNPATKHVFLAHAQSYQPNAYAPQAHDNTVEILDTRSLGVVGTLDVANEPWQMALSDGKIYVASYRDGGMTVIADAETTQPPAPTPTLTPSPYPTLAETVVPVATQPAPAATPTQEAIADCANAVPVRYTPFQEKIETLDATLLGCATGLDAATEGFAFQPLERGFMVDDYRDATAKKVYVFFPDGMYKIYPDTFKDGDDDKICLDVAVPAGRWRPKRGFGTVWCNVPEVQALGAGLVEETNVTLTLQPFAEGMLWELPQRGVVVLRKDGTWE